MNLTDPTKKHCAVWIFDCAMGNPNGDPDRGNLPRQDLSTELGIVTDVALKRKIRNYLDLRGQEQLDKEKYKILIQEGSVINEQIERAYVELDFDVKAMKGSTTVEMQQKVLAWMIKNYVDLRFFGGVLSTGNLKAGQYCGPMQITFAKSVDKIIPSEITITRGAATAKDDNKENKTMGKKTYIPYGVYVASIFFSPCKDSYQLVTEKDLNLFWESVSKCFEINRTASKGLMTTRGLFVFSHRSKLGDYHDHELLDSIRVCRINPNIEYPTDWSDYKIEVTSLDLSNKVSMTKVV